MYCGDIQGTISGDPLRRMGWVRRHSRRWEGCRCRVRHAQQFCNLCYDSKDDQKKDILERLEEGGFYDSESLCYDNGGFSYLISYKDYERWIKPAYENRHHFSDAITVSETAPYLVIYHGLRHGQLEDYGFLRQIGMFFQDTNKPYCEVWFLEMGTEN